MGGRPCKAWILRLRCNKEPPPSVVTEPVVFLVCNGRMANCFICYCPYISQYMISRKGGRGWQSILQTYNRPKLNFTSWILPLKCFRSRRVGYGRIKLHVVIILVGHGAPMEFSWPNFGHFMDTTSRERLWIQLIGKVDRTDEPSCTIQNDLQFFLCMNRMRMSCYVLYDPRIMHSLVKTWGWWRDGW
jgi:hypothetical protein